MLCPCISPFIDDEDGDDDDNYLMGYDGGVGRDT
jgi:hypothetical protein